MSTPSVELIDAAIPRANSATGGIVARGANWRIEPGSFWAIGAFAGAGKTDLLITAAGLQRPVAGEVRLFGKNLATMSEEELVSNRHRVAMIFENGRLFGHLTVAENIALPLNYHGLDRGDSGQMVRDALEVTELSGHADRLPRQVPRLLHQRIALARSLALSPEVLLIDNPLVGVDQRNARWWIDFLCAAHAGDERIGRPLTLVIATDDLRPWIDTAKQFGILREKHLESIGGREEIKASSEKTVRELLADAFDESLL